MLTILTTTSSFNKESHFAVKLAAENQLNIVLNPLQRTLTEGELEELLRQYEPIGMLAGTEPITPSILQRSNRHLKIISRVGVGWDNVDRNAAETLGMKVYRTPGVLTQSVAELTLGLMLDALRHITFSDRLVRSGNWKKIMGSQLCEKTVGIIGFGDIGKKVGELVRNVGASVSYYDPHVSDIQWAKKMTLSELLQVADILSIHACTGDRILGKDELLQCKDKVIIVNTARGSLIDEQALYDFLLSGKIGFACFDVYQCEPYQGPLQQLDNVILTPHIGSYAKEARILMEEMALQNLVIGLREAGAL